MEFSEAHEGGARILVVDDEEVICEILRDFLEYEGFIVDIDLSSFGLPWDEFVRDSAAVRAEFGHLSDDTFYPRQRDFMRKLLARPSFCYTDFFRERHEARARENIRRTIENIDQRA